MELLAAVWKRPNKPREPLQFRSSLEDLLREGRIGRGPGRKLERLTGRVEDMTLVVLRSKVVEHYFTRAGVRQKQSIETGRFCMERKLQVRH